MLIDFSRPEESISMLEDSMVMIAEGRRQGGGVVQW